jgi:hypothetical protein
MAFKYNHWCSLIGKNKPYSVGHYNNIFSTGESAWGFVPAMITGDRLVLTSCRMHGSVGPYKEMTDAFYDNYYTDKILDLFEPQPYNGIQRFLIPANGNYQFTLMGGYAGMNKWRNTHNTDFGTGITITDLGSTQAITQIDGSDLDKGLPGYVVGTIYLTKDTVVDVLVGHSGESAKYGGNHFQVAGSGGGASAVWIGGMPGNSGWIIAGGGGSDRNYQQNYNTTAQSVYGTTGTQGGTGYGGSNGAGGSGNTSNSGSGAGKTGHGTNHGDHRGSPNHINLDTSSNSLDSGGRGAVSGPTYINPYKTTNSYSHPYFYINSSHEVSQCGLWRSGHQSITTTFTDYYYYNTSTMPNTYIPVNCVNGAFGGGGVGNWGGSGGGGGYGGGGAGDNGSPRNGGGAGSSYMSGFTYNSFATYDKDTNKNHYYAPITATGCTLSGGSTNIPMGSWRGNGFVAMERL